MIMQKACIPCLVGNTSFFLGYLTSEKGRVRCLQNLHPPVQIRVPPSICSNTSSPHAFL
jgi:hypothetical protein